MGGEKAGHGHLVRSRGGTAVVEVITPGCPFVKGGLCAEIAGKLLPLGPNSGELI